MFKKNDELVMDITGFGSEGEGIGKPEGFPLFVKKAIPGEKILAGVTKIKKTYGYARIIEIIEKSPDRTGEKCPYAKRCGGCSLQHLDYQAQLKFKTEKVKNNLLRLGGIDIDVPDCIGMDDPWRYRNKAQVPLGKDKDVKLIAGFYAEASHTVIPHDDCLIGCIENGPIVKCVTEFMKGYGISAYDEEKHTGLVRHILIRKGYHTGEIMVCLIINGNDLPAKEELVRRLLAFEGMTSISLNINKEKGNVILGEKIENLYGPGYITDMIGPLSFRINPLAFFQVNPIQTEKLYKKALEFADLKGNETVWDIYCGIGTISLFLAQKAGSVRGIEIIPEAVENAKENALLNGFTNTNFYTGTAEELLPRIYEKEQKGADVIVVDPPRKGCGQSLLETIVKMQPSRVVYVSCDSATLARDLKWLAEHGYETVKVQPVDMFPHTAHVETVCLLSKGDVKSKKIRVEFSLEDMDKDGFKK
ncbi:MAG: 23S rRNA (uracil(1939)-C(5))-methyltransferase RlmD [Lachnospiraceae bacterium]|nr:23S rRNA (uracil(1939)-C(5))-methyltransferase RlmD [Lachnospiraceae bacterium]